MDDITYYKQLAVYFSRLNKLAVAVYHASEATWVALCRSRDMTEERAKEIVAKRDYKDLCNEINKFIDDNRSNRNGSN